MSDGRTPSTAERRRAARRAARRARYHQDPLAGLVVDVLIAALSGWRRWDRTTSAGRSRWALVRNAVAGRPVVANVTVYGGIVADGPDPVITRSRFHPAEPDRPAITLNAAGRGLVYDCQFLRAATAVRVEQGDTPGPTRGHVMDRLGLPAVRWLIDRWRR